MARPVTMPQRLARWAGLWFGGEEVEEAVATRMRFPVHAEALWQALLTYEEVSLTPPWWMRWILPRPLGTQGDKTRVGSALRCRYEGGELTKRMLHVQAPWRLEFEVTTQYLGVENCVRARVGSYEIRTSGNGSEIELTTQYGARLHPRWLWRPVERWLGHAFHRHLLRGMRAQMAAPSRRRREVA